MGWAEQRAADRGTFRAKDYGVVGDGVADDTAALQAAITAVVARGGGELLLGKGVFKVTSQLTVNGMASGRLNGFVMRGENFKATEFVWYGNGTDPVISVENVAWPALIGFRVRGNGANVPGYGIKIDCDAASSGGNQYLERIDISLAAVGLCLGHVTTSASLDGGVYINIGINNCSTACVQILGNNTDGQHFYNLRTTASPLAIYTDGGRNISVMGGSHTNSSGTVGGATMVYFKARGSLGGGNYRFDAVRMESCVRLFEIGEYSGTTNDGFSVLAHFSNMAQASNFATVAEGECIGRFANQGTLLLDGCTFLVPQGYFDFPGVGRTNRFVDFHVNGCHVANDDPFTFGSLVSVTGTAGSMTGGLRTKFRGVKEVDPDTALPTGFISDWDMTCVGNSASSSAFTTSVQT